MKSRFNETGVVLGRLTSGFLRDLLLNYKGGDQQTRERLMSWYDAAIELSSEDDDLAELGLVISKPLVVIGRRVH